jgi:lipid-A-disaccharide synthase-like uncharacterized protein
MNFFALLADFQFTLLGFHVTFNWWKLIGWSGNLIFGTRFLVQWIASERAGRSVIPASFWIVSAIGSICLLVYFVFYRRDSVGIFSAIFPLPIYLRNLFLQARHQHPKHAGNEPNPEQ